MPPCGKATASNTSVCNATATTETSINNKNNNDNDNSTVTSSIENTTNMSIQVTATNEMTSSNNAIISTEPIPVKSVTLAPLPPVPVNPKPVISRPTIPTSDEDINLHEQFVSMIDHVS